MANKLSGLKPQDILVLMKIVALGEKTWRIADLAQESGVSPSEVCMALERARGVGLLDSSKRKVMKGPVLEFLKYGLKYVFPAHPGSVCRGVPTAHSAQPLAKAIVSEDSDQLVWPDENGEVRGQSIEPLYPSVPQAALRDPKLHELLALVDALRVGRAREQKMAAEELARRLSGGSA
ncbi:MAG TPA: hypothetical protein DD417_16420 [Elusimicrobia bacterium]|nr:hypothetical protein [Elusimicrobiota bacterium]